MLRVSRNQLTLTRILPYILISASILGLLASFTLTYDKIHVLSDASYDPNCNINPILSCGSVMKTEQSSLLGVPNTIFGLMAFSMLLTFGVLLATGVKVKRHIWIVAQIAATGGVIFMHYLFFQGVYRINAICPWCFLIWIITIPTFWYITIYNIRENNVMLPYSLLPIRTFILKYHAEILFTWYLIILGIILEHFWYYWSTLL